MRNDVCHPVAVRDLAPFRPRPRRGALPALLVGILASASPAAADSVNSPNITMNVDTNRAAGPGAGAVAVTINTITIAETSLPEYASGGDSEITLAVRPGYQFDPTSPVTIQSATIGFNGDAISAVTTITPAGTADEVLTFALTSGTDTNVQDIIRVNGIRLRILSAAGAAGPAQLTMSVTTTAAGGAFANQGVVAATITRGQPDRLVFAVQPGDTQFDQPLLPAVRVVDFGGNTIPDAPLTLTLALQANPGAATLAGTVARTTEQGVATWVAADALRIATAAAGYTLRASHDGAAFLSADTADSEPFEITAGTPDHLVFTLQPVATAAGEAILLAVTVKDAAENTVTAPPVDVTLDSATNAGGWPLLVDSSLTKSTVDGVAAWDATDRLRINTSVADYRLVASGVGAPVETDAFGVSPAAPAVLRFVQQPSDALESTPIAPPIAVEILDAFGNRTTSTAAVDLTLQSACGGLLSGGMAGAIAGLATFADARVDTPCAGVTLQAASGGLPRTSSDPFSITALPAVALRFVQQPATVEQGAAFNPPVSVELIDAAGNRTLDAGTVNLTLVSACGGVLSTSSAEAVGGLATFAIVSIDVPCTNVTLQATSDGLSGATSETFEVTAIVVEELVPPCGACGQSGVLAIAPMFLWLAGWKRGLHRRR